MRMSAPEQELLVFLGEKWVDEALKNGDTAVDG